METKDIIFGIIAIILIVGLVVTGSIAVNTSNEIIDMKADINTNQEVLGAHQEKIDIMTELWEIQAEYNTINTELWELQLIINEYI